MFRRFRAVVTERETKSFGVNSIGLERRGFSAGAREDIAARVSHAAALEAEHHAGAWMRLRSDYADSDDVRELVKFIEAAERGIVK